jgi:hypothetical protein
MIDDQLCRSRSTLTAGNSQPSGPYRGITISTPSTPLKGLEYVERDVPFEREDSQAGLTAVKPAEESDTSFV